MKVGFAGAGNMAAAMARGWAAGDGGPDEMLFTDGGSGSAAALAKEVGGRALESNAALASEADLVILAVKPAHLDAVGGQLNNAEEIVSLLGATSLERLADAFPHAALVRVMPNVAVEVRHGVLCQSSAPGSEDLAERVATLLAPLGTVVKIDERGMDAATAVMACSPAYVSLVAEALADAGVREGLDERLAYELVVETLAGTSELLRKHDTLSVRRAVTSPGGSTAAGLAALERGAARADFAEAVRASVQRMRGS
jgi:pyrroline-5-carboxylate reductase